ncbi:hypothetical protein JCM19232_5993 [Vibrio ishigakensis]|uniref:Lipoprotein n=1 Tax=Vibrio ishigakensis TaxID=1481914 RepID=A0A0B8PAS2_9VIBR|nr:hypothetical protein JCM19232_5993 [Vibrio ishigakensis]
MKLWQKHLILGLSIILLAACAGKKELSKAQPSLRNPLRSLKSC